MRISDWSSDVCSSDLSRQNQRFQHPRIRIQTNLHDAVRHWEDAKRVRILIELRQHLRKISFPAAFLHFHGDAVAPFLHIDERRSSEARRVGKDGVSTCRSWWSPYH